jgi:hypothetical protein
VVCRVGLLMARAGAPMAPSCAKLRLTYDIEVFLIATYFDQIYL